MKGLCLSAPVLGALLLSFVFQPVALRADQDSIEGPWGTVHADFYGTAATSGISYTLGEGPLEQKWVLDVVAEGHERPGGRSSIVFDKAGNLYWISSTGGGTGGVVRMLSVSPDGKIRWFGNDGAGNVDPLGSVFSGASPVVGVARVYGLGDSGVGGGQTLIVSAYKKDTGERLWTVDLAPSGVAPPNGNQSLTPVLYKGKLYVAGLNGNGKMGDFYQVDAESGDVDWASTIEEVGITALHQMAFVPDAFGAGVHGLYFNGDSGSGTDGISDVYGIKITADEASLGWSVEGGKAGRSHVIYSEVTQKLYTLTWADYGAELYVHDPVTGATTAHSNSLGTGHGFYDVGCLDFDGASIIGGGFEGNILRYTDSGAAITDEVIYKGGTMLKIPYWGENRVLGQLLQDPEGNSILITGTNSQTCCPTHVVALDITNKKLLWQYDTGVIWPEQFQYAGGPLIGPDGKVYFFPRIPPNNTPGLVALGPAAAEPEPTAGFLIADDATKMIVPRNDKQCATAGEVILVDGVCSTGRDITYTYETDPSDGVTITHFDPTDPMAQIVFTLTGSYTVRLTVENAAGSAERLQENFCVVTGPPRCLLSVTDSAGGPIDTADDDDEIPCLTAGGTAIADASGSGGGDLQYDFTVTPAEGVTIEQAGGTSNPRASITFENPDEYVIRVTTTNDQGSAACARKICVKAGTTAPQCALEVKDSAGGAIDDADDDDEIPCLTAGGTAIADASASTGGDLQFAFSVTPSDGVTIEQTGGTSNPKASMTFAQAGGYEIRVTTTNDKGDATCTQTICVKAAIVVDRFLRGDCNSSTKVDLSDAVFLLNFLFLGGGAPKCDEACNFDGSDDKNDTTSDLNITDSIYLLNYLFLGGRILPDPFSPDPPGTCGPDPEPGPMSCATPQC